MRDVGTPGHRFVEVDFPKLGRCEPGWNDVCVEGYGWLCAIRIEAVAGWSALVFFGASEYGGPPRAYPLKHNRSLLVFGCQPYVIYETPVVSVPHDPGIGWWQHLPGPSVHVFTYEFTALVVEPFGTARWIDDGRYELRAISAESDRVRLGGRQTPAHPIEYEWVSIADLPLAKRTEFRLETGRARSLGIP